MFYSFYFFLHRLTISSALTLGTTLFMIPDLVTGSLIRETCLRGPEVAGSLLSTLFEDWQWTQEAVIERLVVRICITIDVKK